MLAAAENAGWDIEVAEEHFTGIVVNLDNRPDKARPIRADLHLLGITMFPFGKDDENTRPRLSFTFDNSNTRNPDLRNRLITLAPAPYWLRWMPRMKDQYPDLSHERDEQVYGMRGDGSMRVRRAELPGFIKFLNAVKIGGLPLLDIRTSDRLARKMINDIAGAANRPERRTEMETLEDMYEALQTLFGAHRYDDWCLGLETEDQIEREQNRATRAATPEGGGRGRRRPTRGLGGLDDARGDTMNFRA